MPTNHCAAKKISKAAFVSWWLLRESWQRIPWEHSSREQSCLYRVGDILMLELHTIANHQLWHLYDIYLWSSPYFVCLLAETDHLILFLIIWLSFPATSLSKVNSFLVSLSFHVW